MGATRTEQNASYYIYQQFKAFKYYTVRIEKDIQKYKVDWPGFFGIVCEEQTLNPQHERGYDLQMKRR